jgi:hypothetical protein
MTDAELYAVLLSDDELAAIATSPQSNGHLHAVALCKPVSCRRPVTGIGLGPTLLFELENPVDDLKLSLKLHELAVTLGLDLLQTVD